MDRQFLGREWRAAQIQSTNPILILVFIPLFSYIVFPAVNRFVKVTALRKIGVGLFVAALSFLVPAWIEGQLESGARVNVGWQILAFGLITAAEVLVAVTCLEFSYTQAPKRMKSLIMAAFYLSVSLGNAFTAGVNFWLEGPEGALRVSGPSYYLLFAGLMAALSIVFIFVAMSYQERVYLQDDAGTG
jgi:POT family proton-dependent oligopeptide transporter